MRIREIRIRNIKAIPKLDIQFSRRITLLHGANGIGKSTIIDSLALLGHLATMRRIVKRRGSVEVRPSALAERLTNSTNLDAEIRARLDSLQNVSAECQSILNALKSTSLEQWFEDDYQRIERIRYDLEFHLDGQSTRCTLVVASTGQFRGDRLTISHALNRSRCDDLDMADVFLALYDETHAAVLDKYINYLCETSTHTVTNAQHAFTTIPRQHSSYIKGNRVIAINTDLNDFGKQDQVRESVKDLQKSFVDEMVVRLGIPFDRPVAPNRMRFRFFDELGAIISRVITDPAAGSRTKASDPFLRLAQCDVENGEAHIRLQRQGEEFPQKTDFFSAGENECFLYSLLC